MVEDTGIEPMTLPCHGSVFPIIPIPHVGARDETRTHTLVAPPPQGGVATNYTTRAYLTACALASITPSALPLSTTLVYVSVYPDA